MSGSRNVRVALQYQRLQRQTVDRYNTCCIERCMFAGETMPLEAFLQDLLHMSINGMRYLKQLPQRNFSKDSKLIKGCRTVKSGHMKATKPVTLEYGYKISYIISILHGKKEAPKCLAGLNRMTFFDIHSLRDIRL